MNHEKTIAVAEHRIKQSTSEIDDKMGKYDEVITNVQRLSSGNVKLVNDVIVPSLLRQFHDGNVILTFRNQ